MSDGFWRSRILTAAAKRPRHENPAASVKFKVVVQQQNGHWGAQIYANHQRIWVGTFRSEREAAMAYDSAAIKLRSGDSHRNIPHTSLSLEEHNFQALYTTEAVLDMIKDGSYDAKFATFIRSKSTSEGGGSEPPPLGDRGAGVRGGSGVVYQQLFQKSSRRATSASSTDSSYAVKYFPSVTAGVGCGEDEGEEDEVQLLFLDSNLIPEDVEVQVLLLEEQAELRVHQRVEQVREGEGVEIEGRGLLLQVSSVGSRRASTTRRRSA